MVNWGGTGNEPCVQEVRRQENLPSTWAYSVRNGGGGKTLICGETLSGNMEVLEQNAVDAGDGKGTVYLVKVPYSGTYVYEAQGGAKQEFSAAAYREEQRREYGVSGSGLQRASVDFAGRIVCQGEDMALELASSSGTLDFSQVSEGQVAVREN